MEMEKRRSFIMEVEGSQSPCILHMYAFTYFASPDQKKLISQDKRKKLYWVAQGI